jgi:PAS domain S-box-containing protein
MAGAKATEHCIEAFDAELDYLFASLRRLGARPAEIEDLAQQVFALLLRGWRASGIRRDLRLHLFRLAVQVMVRHRRGDPGVLVYSPESQSSLILAALDNVPVKRRAVLVLRDLEQVPLSEVARSLSMTRRGAAARLRKARGELEAAIRELAVDRIAVDISQLQGDVPLVEMLMDEVPSCIYFKDRASRFTRINRYAAVHYGIADPELAVGRTDFDFFTTEHAVQALRDEQEIIRTGQPLVSIREKETLPNGRLRWVSTTKLPLRDEGGGIVGIFGLSRVFANRPEPRPAT